MMKTRNKSYDKILVITLGCSKNIVDSERLLTQLLANDLKVDHDKENSDARTVIINTCGFINDAKTESIDTILNFVDKKNKGKIDQLYVIGCLSERYAKELRAEIPEVDKFFGVNAIDQLIKQLGYNYKINLHGERYLTTPKHYAFLKISEGCNRSCSFCAIPIIRGKHVTYSIDELLTESKYLASKGVRELILIAQDTSYYGLDLYKKNQLSYLVSKLSEIQNIEWIRIHYLYPVDFPIELLNVIKNNPKVCKYIDMPIQHISENILTRMRRGHTKNYLLNLIDKIRNSIPEIALRTSLLVGFPGENEKDFEELYSFVEKTRFDRLGVFAYSHEDNTYAGIHYKDDVPVKTKKKRLEKLMKLQQQISYEKNTEKIGKIYKVLIDKKENVSFIGRTQFDSPEVDNEVIISKDINLKLGEFYNVKIYNAEPFDLFGKIV